VDDDVGLVDVGGGGDGQGEAVAHDAVLALVAEDDLLAVADRDEVVAGVLLAQQVEGAVVEDGAVLEDLDEAGAAVAGGGVEDLGQSLAVGVQGAGDEGALGAQGQRQGVERVVERAHGAGLGDLARFGGGRVLALGQAVDAVVEQQDVHVDVAAQGVDEVVAADGHGVAVAGDHPHRQVLAGGGQAGGDGGGASVDGVHPVGLEVVREAARAADGGDEGDVLALESELGQQGADGGQDDVVTAAGAPAHLLVGGVVLGLLRVVGVRDVGQCVQGQLAADEAGFCGGHGNLLLARPQCFRATPVAVPVAVWPIRRSGAAGSPVVVTTPSSAKRYLSCSVWVRRPANSASIAVCSSSAENAMPCTLVMGWISAENRALSSIASWPRFISGTSTRRYRDSTSPRLGGMGLRCRRCARATRWPLARARRTASPIGP